MKMLWQHDPTQPIGVWDEVREDAKGLWVRGRILPDVDKGREAGALLAAGAIDGLSIGYRTVRAERNAKGQRLLQEVELWEVSLVTFPMLAEARVATKGQALWTELAQAVRDVVGTVLRVKPDTLRDDQPLTDLGLDSLMGVEIENLIESSIGVALPPTSLMRARTIGQIAALISEHLGGDGPVAAPEPAAAAPEPVAASEVDLDSLSDQDIDRLLGGAPEVEPDPLARTGPA